MLNLNLSYSLLHRIECKNCGVVLSSSDFETILNDSVCHLEEKHHDVLNKIDQEIEIVSKTHTLGPLDHSRKVYLTNLMQINLKF